MPDVADKTMTPARFTEVAKRAADIDISSPAVQDFIALLKERHVAIDPTLAIFEEMFVNRAGHVPESYESVAGRLPAQFRRNLLTGGLPVPEGMDARYKDSFNNMMKMVKAMYDAGIPVDREDIKVDGDVKLTHTYAGRVVKAVYRGPYSGLRVAHQRVQAFLAAAGYERSGAIWEQYVSDPGTTPEAELVTHIYYPVK